VDRPFIRSSLTRRRAIAGGVSAVAMTATNAFPSFAAAPSVEAMPVSPDDALQRLIDGNARYVANISVNVDYSAGRAQRALGQQPFAAIVSCADSRVAPELIFDQGPGDLFVVRVAGNFINEDGLASLEYGAAVLGIGTIVVLGHSSCGAVDAAIRSIEDGTVLPGHMPSLVEAIRPAVEAAMADGPPGLLAAATAGNAKRNAERARSAEPLLSGLHKSGRLKAVAGVYDIATGKVGFL
jgi:carbonic anhydrase